MPSSHATKVLSFQIVKAISLGLHGLTWPALKPAAELPASSSGCQAVLFWGHTETDVAYLKSSSWGMNSTKIGYYNVASSLGQRKVLPSVTYGLQVIGVSVSKISCQGF